MNTIIDRRTASTLPGNQRRDDRARDGHVHSLVDLLNDGLYFLFMLRNGAKPPHQVEEENRRAMLSIPEPAGELPGSTVPDAAAPAAEPDSSANAMAKAGQLDADLIKEKIKDFLAEFDREARKMRSNGDDIDAAKYAFCAAVDEVIMGAGLMMSGIWQLRPLQLALFGEQLGGHNFFERLEDLRSKGGARLQALQAFHMILLMGYKGKFLHEPGDHVAYLTARLGEEIAHLKGKSRGFAPQAERPDEIINKLRGELPLWVLSAVFAVIALGAFVGMKSSLDHGTQNTLAAYSDLVKLAPRPANVTITLP